MRLGEELVLAVVVLGSCGNGGDQLNVDAANGDTTQPDCSLDVVLNDTVDSTGIDCGTASVGAAPNIDAVRSCIADATAQGRSFKAQLNWDGIKWFLIKNQSRLVELTWESSNDTSNGDLETVWVRQACTTLMDTGMCAMSDHDDLGSLEYGFFCYACVGAGPAERCMENLGGGL